MANEDRSASSRSADLLAEAAAKVRQAAQLAPSYGEAKTYRARLQDVHETLAILTEDTYQVF